MNELKKRLENHLARVITTLFPNPRDAANATGISLITINKILNNKSKFSIERYFELMQLLGQDVGVISDSRSFLMTQRDFDKCRCRGGNAT